MRTTPTAAKANERYLATRLRRNVSSASGSTNSSTTASSSSGSRAANRVRSEARKGATSPVDIVVASGAMQLAPHPGGEEPVRSEIQRHDDEQEDRRLGH